MWRWSLFKNIFSCIFWVFSTYVEVILENVFSRMMEYSILHVCGGDPDSERCNNRAGAYSPRMWRWSSAHNAIQIGNMVFSTYVEVILDHDNRTSNSSCILHVCGGDPAFKVTSFSLILVFSTYVEVILKIYVVACQSLRILHVCGGDPTNIAHKPLQFLYSPRMWRWSPKAIR